MKIAMIAAMANNRIIGADNDMPWHLPADLRHFKAVTLGKPIIMGRCTYESIGRPLPGRPNIVISRSHSLVLPESVIRVGTPEEALSIAEGLVEASGEVMVIGGGTIYSALLDKANRLYLTLIDLKVEGDTQFPDYQTDALWQETSRESHEADEQNPYPYTFVTMERTTQLGV